MAPSENKSGQTDPQLAKGEEQKPTPRRRRRVRWILIVLGLAAIGLSFAYNRGWFSNEYAFVPESSDFFAKLTSQDTSTVEGLYNGAAYAFRETGSLASFVDRADRVHKTLGAFVEIDSIEKIENLSTIRGKTSRIVYELIFENAETIGEVSYLYEELSDEWLLLGFDISVPEELADKVQEVDSERERIKAPDLVVDLADSILRDISDGRAEEVRMEASPPFKNTKSAESFLALSQRLKRELGPYKRRLKILSSGQNADKSRAQIDMILEYEKKTTRAVIEFIKADGAWRLLQFKVEIPEPLLPNRRR